MPVHIVFYMFGDISVAMQFKYKKMHSPYFLSCDQADALSSQGRDLKNSHIGSLSH